MITDNDLIELKIKTVDMLVSIDLQNYELDKIDNRLYTYVSGCIEKPDDHNLYELLAVVRFFKFCDKYDLRTVFFKKFALFYERLKFSGIKGKTRYKLTPVQVFQVVNIFCFYHPGTNKRVVREALLFVPRKFSKTTFCASLAIYDLLFGDYNAQSYVAANSYQQAKICFDEIRNILRSLDKGFRNFKINREAVYNLRPGRTSFARCLASNPDSLDGLNASTAIIDEYSQADSSELKNVITSSMGARLNPLTVIITTASDKTEGVFYELLQSYKAVLRGEMDNNSVFAHVFEPDAGDAENDPHTWRKVHPHLGVTVQEDYYENEWIKAQMSADDMFTFRTKLLNLFVRNDLTVWFQPDEIKKMFCKSDFSEHKNAISTIAIDLSVYDDFSCVCYNMYDTEKKKFHIHNDYYLPEATLKNHRNRELYKRWADKGMLTILPGNVIDYSAIANEIIKNAQILDVRKIGYDPYKSAEFVRIIESSGGKRALVPVKQTYGAFTSPLESFELVAKTGRLTMNDNEINSYCFANAVIDEDRLGNKKPIKITANGKIDGAITSLMTFYLFNTL